MEKISSDISKKFIDDISKTNSVVIQVGTRHSGKTLFSMSVLRYCIQNKLFDQYHLVIPTFKYQSNDTFKWFNSLSQVDQDRITVYESFGLFIVNDLIKNRKRNGNVLFMVDDATQFMSLFGQSPSLRKLIVESRHLRCSTWLISHTLKSTINPLIRSNTAYYLLHKQSNAGFLSSLWEENLSLFVDKKDFMGMCRDKMLSKDFVCIVIDSDRSVIDCNAMMWDFIVKQRDSLLKLNSKVYKSDDAKKSNPNKPITTDPKAGTQRNVIWKIPSLKNSFQDSSGLWR